MSNTSFLSREPEGKEFVQGPNAIILEKKLLRKINILAKYYDTSTEELIDKALNHFLRLKTIDFEKALQKLAEEEEGWWFI